MRRTRQGGPFEFARVTHGDLSTVILTAEADGAEPIIPVAAVERIALALEAVAQKPGSRAKPVNTSTNWSLDEVVIKSARARKGQAPRNSFDLVIEALRAMEITCRVEIGGPTHQVSRNARWDFPSEYDEKRTSVYLLPEMIDPDLSDIPGKNAPPPDERTSGP
jgi:hypothetical protein